MLNNGRSDEILDAEFVDLDEPAPVELVPLTQSLHMSPRLVPRPDPTFITHLIATADRAPQTCLLRRGSLADAQTAYGANRILHYSAGFQTRQTI